MGWRTKPSGWIAGSALMMLVAMAPASARAEHAIDRVETPEDARWNYLGSSSGGQLDITRTGEDSFQATLSSSPLAECFPAGTLLYELRGHEPHYEGVEYIARTQEDPETGEFVRCTGEYFTVPATFDIVQTRDRLTLNKVSERAASYWSMDRVDSDGDEIRDDEERSGVNPDDDPEIEVDLEAMGADPQRKDVFVEIDYMTPHQITDDAVRLMGTAFANAPVSNPDGSSGISLHADAGPSAPMNPAGGERWGELSEAEAVPHRRVLGAALTDDSYDWGEFDALKDANFIEEREHVFHYGIAAHGHPSRGAGGESRGAPASDFMLGLGVCGGGATDCTPSATDQAAATMHELGHNFGLEHGGFDPVNFKPNHFSVMNYNFAYGIPMIGGGVIVDYGRLDTIAVPSLDETALDERGGVRASGFATNARTFFTCPGTDLVNRIYINEAVDFDCDGTAGGTVAADINRDDSQGALRAYTEWAGLDFGGGAIGARVNLLPPDRTPTLEEPGYSLTREHVHNDFQPPELKLKLRGGPRGAAKPSRRVIVVARDRERLDRLVVAVKKRAIERTPRGKGRRARVTLGAKPGSKVAAVALDLAGHTTKRSLRVR